jgi:uncharacterized protein with von Willebrand factor type A (vWA) domain
MILEINKQIEAKQQEFDEQGLKIKEFHEKNPQDIEEIVNNVKV